MATSGFRLILCGPDGQPVEPVGDLPPMLREACAQSATFYAKVGYAPPWIGYLSVCDGRPVGCGGFVGAPSGGRVEIAYATVPELEGQGFATRTAAGLIEIARAADPKLTITAKTLPEPNASTKILERLGFAFAGETTDHEVGTAWRWTLAPEMNEA